MATRMGGEGRAAATRAVRIWTGLPRPDRADMAVLAAAALAGTAGYLAGTRGNGWVFGEDGIVEWASAATFAAGSGLAMLRIGLRDLRAMSWDRAVLWYVCAACALCFLSEISFGARLGGYAMPAMAGGGELDGGQDLVTLAARLLESFASDRPLAAFALFAAAAAAGVWATWRWHLVQRLYRWQAQSALRQFAVLATAALLFAVGIDTLERTWLRRVEELAELGAAWIFLAAALSAPKAGRVAAG